MRKGFTLIELLLVVVIIGIVAAFVLPKFGDVKEMAYVSGMKSDLRNLATAQEIEFATKTTGYLAAASVTDNTIANAPHSEDITLAYAGAVGSPNRNQDGYVAVATHAKTSQVCVLNRTNGSYTAAEITGSPSVSIGALICGEKA